jgi:hypothetical protein
MYSKLITTIGSYIPKGVAGHKRFKVPRSMYRDHDEEDEDEAYFDDDVPIALQDNDKSDKPPKDTTLRTTVAGKPVYTNVYHNTYVTHQHDKRVFDQRQVDNRTFKEADIYNVDNRQLKEADNIHVHPVMVQAAPFNQTVNVDQLYREADKVLVPVHHNPLVEGLAQTIVFENGHSMTPAQPQYAVGSAINTGFSDSGPTTFGGDQRMGPERAKPVAGHKRKPKSDMNDKRGKFRHVDETKVNVIPPRRHQLKNATEIIDSKKKHDASMRKTRKQIEEAMKEL